MILRARAVVTMEGAPIPDGAVVVRGNRILDVGPWPEVRGRNTGVVLDLGERVLLPGLINAHCHLDYTDLRGTMSPTASFTDWIRAINERKASWREEDYLRSIEHGLYELEKFGTTTVVNFEAFPDLIGKISPALRIWWLAEMIDVRNGISAADVYEKLRAAIGGDPLSRIGLAPHAPYTASRELYAEAAAIGAKDDAVLSTHLAESGEEMRMFREAEGPLYDFMKSIGRPLSDCGAATPVAMLLSRGLLDERWLVAHMNELAESDFRKLEGAPKFTIVHCPQSHAYFGHSRFPLQKLRRLGFNICLGTDSLASNVDLSLFAEMRQLSIHETELTAQELLEMVTLNPASALDQGNRLGRLQSGYADLIALPFSASPNAVYEEIVAFDGVNPWRMVNGRLGDNA